MTDDTKRAENQENDAAAEPQAANENNPVAVLEAQVAERVRNRIKWLGFGRFV